MEMHQLRYAVAVARAGNFSKAAEQCHVSQPSLSQQILKLEEELGERLFDRTKREAKPTAHGEAFLRRAVRILQEVDGARREAEDAKSLNSGTVTLGVLPTIAPYLLPEVMTAFSSRYPAVEMIVQEETTSRLLKLLHGYEIDFALISLPFREDDTDRLNVMPLLTEELMVALPPDHLLARKNTLTLHDLQQERLIVMQEGHCLGDQVLGFCNRRDFRPKISFRSAQLETIRFLVASGMGISLIPAMATGSEKALRPVYRSLSGEKPERKIVAAWPRQRPPGRGSMEFLNLLVQELKPRVRRKK